MWAHYAQCHQGAVFKLRRLEHLDHPFIVAQPVEYPSEPASYASAEEYARHLVGIEQFDPTPRIWRLAYRKHAARSYEREWRVHVPSRATDECSREVLAARTSRRPSQCALQISGRHAGIAERSARERNVLVEPLDAVQRPPIAKASSEDHVAPEPCRGQARAVLWI